MLCRDKTDCCRIFVLLIAIVVVVLPSLSGAHSLFIQSGRHHVTSGKGSPLFFCYGHHFPVDEAVRRNKLAYVKVIDPLQQVLEVALRDEHSLHSYVVQYDKPGTYVLTAQTSPGYFAMYRDKKGRKRHSLKPLDTFIDDAKSVQSSMRSSQWAKSYVVCDAPSQPFPAEVGLPLELVPDKDPTLLKQGDQLVVQVYRNGNPYQGEGFWDATYAGFSTEAEDLYVPRTAVSTGRFVVPIDANGRWFVRFFIKTEAPPQQRHRYLTDKQTSTLTFLVRNERKRPKNEQH
nr:DUF4198 domain-containing protein [uncultured Desulfuromonas sp.]